MQAAAQIAQLETNCAEFGIPIYGFGSDTQGIVHVIGPELGLTQPGMTIVCGDSPHGHARRVRRARVRHRDERGRAWCSRPRRLLQRKPKTYEVRVDGR